MSELIIEKLNQIKTSNTQLGEFFTAQNIKDAFTNLQSEAQIKLNISSPSQNLSDAEKARQARLANLNQPNQPPI